MEKTSIRYINSFGEVISSFLCTNCPGGSVPIAYEDKIVCDECNRVIAIKSHKPQDNHKPEDSHKPHESPQNDNKDNK